MITYLACCLSKQAGKQEPEPPVSDTQCLEDIKNRIQRLQRSNNGVSTDVAHIAKIPVFTYGECLLKCSAEHVLMMQPLAMLKPLNWDIEDGEVDVNDSNNNSQDPKPFSISESSISAHPASNMDNIHTPSNYFTEVLNYPPSIVPFPRWRLTPSPPSWQSLVRLSVYSLASPS